MFVALLMLVCPLAVTWLPICDVCL